MNNVRPHPSMLNLNGANNPSFLPQGGLANLGAMNQNGMTQPHPPGGMQHPGQQLHLLQQQQQMNHAGGGGPHPPPMGGLQSGSSPLGGQNMVQNGMGGAPGIQYTMAQQNPQMNPQMRQQMLDRQMALQQQHQRQQLNQGFSGGGIGGLSNQQHANLSGMVGGASGMSNLGHLAGGQMNGIGNGIPNLQQMNAQLQQGIAMRRVPSTNQPQSSQQIGGLAGQPQQGNPGANMNMMMGNNQIAALRQGGLLTGLTNTQQHQQQLQRLQNQQHGGSHPNLQGQQQQQHPLGGMGHLPNGQDASRELPANVAAAFSQRPSNFANAHGAMSTGMSNIGAGGMNPNVPGAQRVPSAQAMTPGHSAGAMGHPGIPTHINHTPNPQQQNAHNAQQPPFVNPLHQPPGHNNMQPPQMQQQHQHPGQLSQQPGMPGARGQGMPGGLGMPGAQHGPGQSLHGHPNSASPPRSGAISQPQTPALPMAPGAGRPQSRQGEGNMNVMMVNSTAGRPQSRQGEGNMSMMMGFPGSQASLAMPGLGRPGQPGQQQSGQPGPSMQNPGGPTYPPYGVPGFTGGRITPQNPQNPMAGLGNSPGGPGPGPGMQAPQLTQGAGGRMGSMANATVPTPAGILAANQASGQRMNDYGHMPPLNQNMQGHLGTPHVVPPQRPPSQTRGNQPPIFTSPVVRPAGHQQGQELHSHASPQNGQRRGTPIQPPMGTPLMHAAHPPGTQPVQQKRPPSRSMGTPHQQPQQAGPSRMTPRPQPATLPPTPSSSTPQSHEGTYNIPVRAGLGIGAPNSAQHPNQTSPSTQQQPHPPTPQATQQSQNQSQTQIARAQQQRPPTRTGVPPTGTAPTENGLPPPGQAMLGIPLPQGPRPPMYPAQAFTAPIATTRLQRFSDTLSQPKMPGSENYWISVVNEFFHPQAIVKITLWKDNMQNEAKPFEISMPILPRFFLVTSESGVSSMSISLENPVERPGYYTLPLYSIFLECANAAWTFRYTNGYIVTLRGPLTAHLVLYPANHPTAWKFESITFNSQTHEKALKIDAIKGPRSDPTPLTPGMKSESSNSTMNSPSHDDERATGEFVVVINRATIPAEPVNAFGIPQATMRCLELAESVGQMSELIEFSLKTGSGPLDALKGYAKQIRESHGYGSFQGQQNIGQSADGTMNGVAASPAVTLYQSSPIPSHSTTSGSGLLPPHNVMANQPLRQQGQIIGDTSSPLMASTPASAQTPTAPPLSAGPSNSSHSTPMLVHTTLKRKAGDTSSPTTNTEQAPPAKRAQRKRSARQGGG